MIFEHYQRAALGDLPYIENLLNKHPELIDSPYNGQEQGTLFLGYYLIETNKYALSKIGVKEDLDQKSVFYFKIQLLSTMPMALIFGPMLLLGVAVAIQLDMVYSKEYKEYRHGWTLLQFAAEKGQYAVALHLIKMGANTSNNFIEIAIKNGHKQFVIMCEQQIEIENHKIQTKNKDYIIQTLIELCASNNGIPVSNHIENDPIKVQTQSRTIINNHDQYDDQHISSLLKIYLQDDVVISSPVSPLIRQENNSKYKEAEQNFIDTVQSALDNDRPSIILINSTREVVKQHCIEGAHWISLVVEPQSQTMPHRLTMIDSLGSQKSTVHQSLIDIIHSQIMNSLEVNLYMLNQQKGDLHCGAWFVDNSVQFIQSKSFRHPRPEQYLDNPMINGQITGLELRQEHNAVLSANDPTNSIRLLK